MGKVGVDVIVSVCVRASPPLNVIFGFFFFFRKLDPVSVKSKLTHPEFSMWWQGVVWARWGLM